MARRHRVRLASLPFGLAGLELLPTGRRPAGRRAGCCPAWRSCSWLACSGCWPAGWPIGCCCLAATCWCRLFWLSRFSHAVILASSPPCSRMINNERRRTVPAAQAYATNRWQGQWISRCRNDEACEPIAWRLATARCDGPTKRAAEAAAPAARSSCDDAEVRRRRLRGFRRRLLRRSQPRPHRRPQSRRARRWGRSPR